jgi:hypothetical protein
VDYSRLAAETTWADLVVGGLAAGLWGYAGLALMVERLGWAMLQRELKVGGGRMDVVRCECGWFGSLL